MFINTKIDNIVVSIIKKNNKISLGIMLKGKTREDNKMLHGDSLFPFSTPLVTDSALRMFEFIIEANNFAERYKNGNKGILRTNNNKYYHHPKELIDSLKEKDKDENWEENV